MSHRKVYKEVRRLEETLEPTKNTVFTNETDHKKAWSFIVEELFKELNLQIYKYDRDGKLEYDNKGRPKIDWLNVIFGAFKLVAKIIVLRNLFEQAVLGVKALEDQQADVREFPQ